MAPDQVVPLRDQVPERTAAMAERDAAVHAAPGLPLKLGLAELRVYLAPVLDPDVDRAPLRRPPRRGHESPRVCHAASLCRVTRDLRLGASRCARRAIRCPVPASRPRRP